MKRSFFYILILNTFISGNIFARSYTEVKGFIKMRYLSNRGEAHGFQFYETELRSKYSPNSMVDCLIDLELLPDIEEVNIDQLYGRLKNFPDLGPSASGELIVGKARNYCFGAVYSQSNRVTSDYGLVSDFVTRRKVTGLQYLLDHKQIKVNIGIYNGFSIGTRSFGDEGVLLSLEDSVESENNHSKELSMRISAATSEEYNIGVSVATSEISSIDLIQFNKIMGTNSDNKSYAAFGIDFTYDNRILIIRGEIYSVALSSLESIAYSVLTGRNFDRLGIYMRVGYITYDEIKKSDALNATWDKIQLQPYISYKMIDNVKIQIEGKINMEDKPAGVKELNNDQLFVELKIDF